MINFYRFIGRFLFIVALPIIRIIIKRTQRAYVAIIYNGNLLIVKNWLARNTWRLPGGGVQRNESPQECIVREAKEELGISLDINKVILLHEGVNTTDRLGFVYAHYYYICESEPQLKTNRFEINTHMWTNEQNKDIQFETRRVISELSEKKMIY